MPNNILIVGNGFDLYHKLPTRYSDFMFCATQWESFREEYYSNTVKEGPIEQISVPLTEKGELTHEALAEFGKHKYLLNAKHIEFLDKHLPSNTWIQCFSQLLNQGLNWIDFEAEIQKVLEDAEEYSMQSIPNNVGKRGDTDLPDRLKRIPDIFGAAARNGYLNFGAVDVLKHYVDKRELQQNKERLIEFMINELNNLITCLQYYLSEFVANIKCDRYSEQIKALGEVDLLNFNYTTTFHTVYGSHSLHEHHAVHGGIVNGDIVLGISDDAFPDTYDYIRFQKYFQRIQKRTGSYYRDWNLTTPDDFGGYYEANVFIMGHSLGIADFGVLSYFFDNRSVRSITIFHHNQKSYEDLVVNLVKALGKEKVIGMIGDKKIEFEMLKDPVLI